jgi:hypothetical protein
MQSATNASGSNGSSGGIDPSPVVSLGKVENNITVSLGCYPGSDTDSITEGGNTIVHSCSLSNVPIQKWVHLVVSVYGRSMDLYLGGKLVRTCVLPGIASVNNDTNVFITPMGGFDGWTSKFQYYPDALNPQEVWNMYAKGYSSWLSSFNSYQLQISLVENGNEQGSVVI